MVKIHKRGYLVACKLQRVVNSYGLPTGSPARDARAQKIINFINKYYYDPLNNSTDKIIILIKY